MPSPIAHSASAYILAKILPLKQSKFSGSRKWEEVLYAVFVANAADLDFIPQLITGELSHRGLTHSLIFTFGFSAIASFIISYYWQSSYKQLFWLTSIIYGSHLFLDFFSEGRGIPLFLPFIINFFKSPIIIFPGVHYSRGLWDYSHLTPIVFESIYSALLLGGLWLFKNKTRNKTNI